MAIPVEDVRAVAAPIIASAGMDIEDISITTVGRREKVVVIVDADGGVGLDAIAELSQAISAELDAREDLASAAYVLEVTSPGVDRPLREPRHWRRAKDRLVAVQLVDGTSFQGRVKGSDETSVVLDVAGDERSVDLANIAEGVVQVEFDRKES